MLERIPEEVELRDLLGESAAKAWDGALLPDVERLLPVKRRLMK